MTVLWGGKILIHKKLLMECGGFGRVGKKDEEYIGLLILSEDFLFMNHFLSKSQFIRGLQCHKSLWLYKFKPEIRAEPDESAQASFDSGTEVGLLARELFHGGKVVEFEGSSFDEKIRRTKEFIESGVKTIYEATFCYNDILVMVDILHKGKKGWEIYEVKQAKKVKEVYKKDVAIQYHVVSGSGISVSKVYLVHINGKYIRKGDINVRELFHTEDLTNEVIERQAFVKDEIKKMRQMLTGECPIIDIGPHCDDPYECDFATHCWSHIPEQSVFSLRDHGKPDAMELYRKGIIHIKDIPYDLLGWRQKLQVDGLLYQKNHINQEAVEEFLDALWYPICFMDFETTYMVPIPLFDGTSPYQQIPFQYSLDIIEQPTAEFRHFEFLSDGKADPRPPFLQNLLSTIPENACILIWNNTFEPRILRELAVAYPSKCKRIESLIDRIIDMMVPFKRKDIYHWQFNGSYSIKEVLPALLPNLSYDDLDISDGAMASEAWMRMIQTEDAEEAKEIKKQLLAYCGLDTLGMVKILEKMREMVE